MMGRIYFVLLMVFALVLSGCNQDGEAYTITENGKYVARPGDGVNDIIDEAVSAVNGQVSWLFGQLTGPSSLCATSTGTPAKVTNIVDGDTFDVQYWDKSTARIRLIGMNAPEVGDVCSESATIALGAMLKDQQILLEKDVSDVDRYGRKLRYVCNQNHQFVNAAMVWGGFAEPMSIAPDVKNAGLISQMEQVSMSENRGCLHTQAIKAGEPGSESCSKVCVGQKVCGDQCVDWGTECNIPPGTACQG